MFWTNADRWSILQVVNVKAWNTEWPWSSWLVSFGVLMHEILSSPYVQYLNILEHGSWHKYKHEFLYYSNSSFALALSIHHHCTCINGTCEGMTTPSHCIKKKTFSRRPRKSPNLCPTLTQRHRRPVRPSWSLDLCFGMGQTRGFF